MKKIIVMALTLLTGSGLFSQNVTKFEYFFDTDPGYGMGTAVPIGSPQANVNNFTFNIPVTGLANGFHHFFIRGMDANGKWSITQRQNFFKQDVPVTSNPYVVNKLEYFIDDDPGYGLGTAVALTPAANISNFAVVIQVGSYTDGFHSFSVRALDSKKSWSEVIRVPFFKYTYAAPVTQNITKIEYYFDTDPGFGSGLNLTFTPGSNLVDLLGTIPVGQLTPGFHKLYIRARDNAGAWSLTHVHSFYSDLLPSNTDKNITRIEYFFDTDPGYGSANCGLVSFTPGNNLVNITAEIPVGSLTPGFHKIFIRAKDETGAWSNAHYRSFYSDILPGTNIPNLTYGEYFLDTDPGFGNGEEINFNPSANLVNQVFAVDLTGVSNGFHKLFIRFKDANGKWSTAVRHDFFVVPPPPGASPNITYMEYFIDTDPGYGSATQITGFTQGTDIQNFILTLPLNTISAGFHSLFIRARDAQKRWSHTMVQRFYKDNLPPTVVSQIAELKYFIGQGNAIDYNAFIPVADFTPALNVEDFIFSIPLPTEQFPVGYYKIYALAKDLNGRSTTIAVDSFRVCDNVAEASFTFEVASRTVTFTDHSLLAFSYLWNFGDGTTSTEANPVHTYSVNGSYNVCLTVTNDCNESTYCDSVSVTYNAPPSSTSFDVAINEDQRYTFAYGSFSYYDEEGNALNHLLLTEVSLATGDSLVVNNVPVGTGSQILKNDISNFQYVPAADQAGYRGYLRFRVSDGITYSTYEYTINFTVTAINDSATYTLSNAAIVVIQDAGEMTISNWLLNLDDGDPNEDQTINLQIYVIEGNNLFDVYPILSNNDLHFTVKNGVTGMSRCRLTITDYGYNPSYNTQNANFTIEIKPFAAQLAANKTEACTGEEVIFTSTSPTQGVSFAWEFGQDANPATYIGPEPDPVVYSTPGTKSIKLTIAGFGRTDNKTININILQTPTAAFLTGANIFPLYDTVYFYNTSIGGLRYEWNFGDGTPILVKTTTVAVKHKYVAQDQDTFQVVLTVINGICSHAYSQTIKFINANPPQILTENFASEYVSSTTTTVGVVAKDLFYPLGTAKFYYKGISGNQWSSRIVTLVRDSVYETTIQETMGDQVGIAYFFDVFNNLGLRRRSNIGYAYLKYEGSGLPVPNLSFGPTVDKYQIISIPLTLQNSEVSSVLDELGPHDNTKWRLFHYTPTKLYEYPADFQNFEKGKGYWLIARNQTTINTGSGTTHSGVNFENFSISLRQGWTQIGNPYTFNVSWQDILDANPTYASEIGSLRTYTNGSFANATVLRAFGGGFVFANQSGIELIIPIKPTSATKSGVASETGIFDENNWMINMQLKVNDFTNNSIGFGMNETASLSRDKFDEMTVPRFFNFLEANFEHPEYFYPKFATDVVPSKENFTWEMNVETSYPGEFTTLTWENNKTIFLPSYLKLVDTKYHKVIDMKDAGRYSFLYNGPQKFKIIYGELSYLDSVLRFDETLLGECYPNPFSQKTTIPVYIRNNEKGSSRVELSIFNLDGRKMLTLVNGEIKQGYHEFEWNAGNGLKPGLYLCTLYNFTDGTTISKRMVIMQ